VQEVDAGAPLVYGPAIGFEPDGSVVSTVRIGAQDPLFFSWHPSGAARRVVPGTMPGFVLP